MPSQNDYAFSRRAIRREFERKLKPCEAKVKYVKFLDIWPTIGEDAYWFFDWLRCETSVQEMVAMLFDSSKCSNEVLIATLFILEKSEKKDPTLKISPFTVSSLLMTAVVIAHKAGGETIKEGQFEAFEKKLEWRTKLGCMKNMERCLLNIINSEVGVNYPDYDRVWVRVIRTALEEQDNGVDVNLLEANGGGVANN